MSAKDLFDALRFGNLSKLREFLQNGADPNAKHFGGITSLWIPSYKGYEQIVRELLDAGVIVDAANSNGETPLIAAARLGHFHVVKALLDSDAFVDARNN